MANETSFIDSDALVDLPNFGRALDKDDVEFRWPKKNDLDELGLYYPPKLIKIITQSSDSGQLNGIKLVFEDGISSPFFDADPQSKETSTEVNESLLQTSDITKIAAEHKGYFITKLRFKSQNGD